MKYIHRILVQKACKFKTYSGFTLVEVLVTLAIIGIVAALTIPSLITNIRDQQYKTAFKQNYADIAQATMRMVDEKGGSLLGLFPKENPVFPADAMMNDYSTYLNFIKTSGWGMLSTCWQRAYINQLDGNLYDISGSSRACATLSNGALLAFISGNSTCTGSTSCGDIWIDVNGFKEPNTWGKDVFAIHVNTNSTTPYTQPTDGGCGAGSAGFGCASWVLLDRNY